jgi:hypothetical protein
MAHGASVTAMEIMHAVLSNPDTAARSFFFERDPNWDWVATLNEADRAVATAETDAKAKLRTHADQRKVRVEAWRGRKMFGESHRCSDTLLRAVSRRRPPGVRKPRLHRAYAREQQDLHIGAEDYIRDLNRWMETKDATPLLITGLWGKSTLVANWACSA